MSICPQGGDVLGSLPPRDLSLHQISTLGQLFLFSFFFFECEDDVVRNIWSVFIYSGEKKK